MICLSDTNITNRLIAHPITFKNTKKRIQISKKRVDSSVRGSRPMPEPRNTDSGARPASCSCRRRARPWEPKLHSRIGTGSAAWRRQTSSTRKTEKRRRKEFFRPPTCARAAARWRAGAAKKCWLRRAGTDSYRPSRCRRLPAPKSSNKCTV